MHIEKNVTTAGTPVRLVATTVTSATERFCARVTVTAKNGNGAGLIYVTQSNSTPDAAEGIRLPANDSYTYGSGETRGNSLDLATIWIDSSVNGDGVFAEVEQI